MATQLFPPESVIPSKEKSQKWIFVDSRDKVWSEYGGKWLLFHDCINVSHKRGMADHDYAWMSIKKLVISNSCSSTGIYSAKCSTAWNSEYEVKPGSAEGVICCYTFNCNDKRLAKRAADAIRRVCYYPKDMFYQTDDVTNAMKYDPHRCIYVSMYKHTFEKQLYERDPSDPNKWIPVRN